MECTGSARGDAEGRSATGLPDDFLRKLVGTGQQSLAAFVVVAEEAQFSRAGTRLCLNKSQVSRAVSRLEAELGQRLFDRTTRHVGLTARGSAALPKAVSVLRHTFVLYEAVRDNPQASA